MIQPKFLPNDIVYGIPEYNSGWSGLPWYGQYKISKVEIVSEDEFRYYAMVAGAFYVEIKLDYVFASREEFIKFLSEQEYGFKSPKK